MSTLSEKLKKALDFLKKNESKYLYYYYDDEKKRRHITEDFIKGRLIQALLKIDRNLFIYQDVRIKYWNDTPDQYADLVITNNTLDFTKTLAEILKSGVATEMIICEIKLSSNCKTKSSSNHLKTREEEDKDRLKKLSEIRKNSKNEFYFIKFELDSGSYQLEKIPPKTE